MKKVLLLIISTFVVTNVFGSDLTYFAMLGYGSVEKKGGVEISLGMQLKPYEKFNLDIAPLTGVIISKKDSRYTEEKAKNNNTVCRDKSNGQFADKKNCEKTSFQYGFESSIKYQVHEKFDGGIGFRIGNKISIYIVGLIKFNTKLGIEGKLGNEYGSITFRSDF